MVIGIKVEYLDWQVFNYQIEDVVCQYESFKDVVKSYGYDYNGIKSYWKKKGILSVEINQFIHIDDNDNIGAMKFGNILFIDLNDKNDKFYFYPNIKTIVEVFIRDEKIKTIINI